MKNIRIYTFAVLFAELITPNKILVYNNILEVTWQVMSSFLRECNKIKCTGWFGSFSTLIRVGLNLSQLSIIIITFLFCRNHVCIQKTDLKFIVWKYIPGPWCPTIRHVRLLLSFGISFSLALPCIQLISSLEQYRGPAIIWLKEGAYPHVVQCCGRNNNRFITCIATLLIMVRNMLTYVMYGNEISPFMPAGQ